MASTDQVVEIRDESNDEEIRHQLLMNGQRRGLVTKTRKNGEVKFHWQVYGPIHWSEAKIMMQGLLDLTVMADQLSGERKNVKGKR